MENEYAIITGKEVRFDTLQEVIDMKKTNQTTQKSKKAVGFWTKLGIWLGMTTYGEDRNVMMTRLGDPNNASYRNINPSQMRGS